MSSSPPQKSDDACAGQPVAPELYQQLVEPFVTAVGVALREAANTEVLVREVHRRLPHRTLGEVSAVIGLMFPAPGLLVLGCARSTAVALAERLLAGVPASVDERLVHDCLGELANITAGQAKALLLGTPYHFAFATPNIMCGAGQEVGLEANSDCLVITLASDAGELFLQLFVSL
jgi:chemotaxis protein CheX